MINMVMFTIEAASSHMMIGVGDARERYPMQQKLLFSLLSASRKLRHYF